MTVTINGNGTITGLSVVPDPGANGVVVRTSSTTATARTITAGAGVTVTNGDGVSGNPTITNSGVTSIVAGTGITISGATGAVTVNSSATAPTTAQVLSATAGLTAGDVGSYAMLRADPISSPGTTYSGSSVYWSTGNAYWNTAVGYGTWRLLGQGNAAASSLFVRIS